jgi:hypothetical protein
VLSEDELAEAQIAEVLNTPKMWWVTHPPCHPPVCFPLSVSLLVDIHPPFAHFTSP